MSGQFSARTELDDSQFGRWCELLLQRTGITLEETRRSFLVSQLNIRMRELGYVDYQDYYDLIIGGSEGRIEWETLVDRLTVHETRFFRESLSLPVIQSEFLNHLDTSSSLNLDVWSVGCATGEEPYTLLMYIDRVMQGSTTKHYIGITASDISSASLAAGRKGVYHKTRLKNVPAEYMQQYLRQVDETHYQVRDSLRSRVCFTPVNVMQIENSSVGMMDLIVCQNVLIYFKKEQRLQILDNLVKHLKPGGLLVIGVGEITDWHNRDIKPVSQQSVLAYRRIKLEKEA